MTMLDNQLSLASSLKEEQTEQLDQMVEAIVSSFNK